MLLESNVDTTEFQKIFDKKFSNFCDKAPLLISYQLTPMGVIVKNIYSQESNEFKFNFEKEVSQNIFDIKTWLVENWYPTLVDLEEKVNEYSAEELSLLMQKEGLSLDQALKARKVSEVKTVWRIEKVILKRDELFVRNISTDQLFRYKMRMPTTIFLQRLRDRYTKEEAFSVFKEKASIISLLD